MESLIVGKKEAIRSNFRDFDEFEWIFEIVNNKRNSIDVDKFDYLWRDMKYTGVGLEMGFDYSVLTQNARVIEGQLCYPIQI